MTKYFVFEDVEVDNTFCLKWIIEDFLPKDLDNLPYLDRFSIIKDLIYYLYSGKLRELNAEEASAYESYKAAHKKHKGMRVTDGVMCPEVAGLPVDNIISIGEILSENFWQKVIDIKRTIKEKLTKEIVPFFEGKKKYIVLPEKYECRYFLIRSNNLIKSQPVCQPVAGYEQEFFLYPLLYFEKIAIPLLLTKLDKIPATAIRRCQECNRLFVQLKGKARKFCSKKCMNRWHTRKRRQADPEAYRAKQREIMRKRYERKQKEKYGPNVKINRRKEE